VAGVIAGGSLLALGKHLAASALARTSFLAIGGAWTLLAGLGGLILAGLWGLTDHNATYANENLLQLCPLALALTFCLCRVARHPDAPHPFAARIAVAVALSSLAGLVIKLLPGPSQVNWEILAFAVPVNVGLAVALVHSQRSTVDQRP
jgi:hypothetical protein